MYSFSNLRRVALALPFAAVLSLAFVFAAPAHAATNLIANGDLEASTTVAALPDHWNQGYFGTNTVTYGYGTAFGHTGKGINVNITAYAADDAKWVFDSVPVTGSSVYTFSDWYKSDQTSYLMAQYTYADNSVTYSQVATLTSAANWTQTSQAIIVPANATAVSVFHVLRSAGNLATDDYSLSLADASQTQFDSGIVSLTFDDGWMDQYTEAFPLLGTDPLTNLKGTFYIIGTALRNAVARDLFLDAGATADMQPPVVTATSVSWGPIYTSDVGSYTFTDTYTAAGTSQVKIMNATSSAVIATSPSLPAGSNLHASLTASIPNGTGVIITHTSSAALSVSAKAFKEANITGYMSPTEVQKLMDAGNEVGNHTESHCNLRFLETGLNGVGQPTDSTDPNTCSYQAAGLTYKTEIDNGAATLKSLLGVTVQNFAYPNGATNDVIEQYIAGDGYASARTVDEGMNTKQADRMALKVEVVDQNANIGLIQSWIDSAAANKLWLILVFHQVDTPATLQSDGADGGTTPVIFGQIVDYLKNKSGIQVKTVAEALGLLPGTPTDTTTPVITVTGANPMQLTVGDTYSELGATATDDGHEVSVAVSGSVNTAVVGTYTITYTAQDAVPHIATATRTVNVAAAAPGAIQIVPATLPSTTVGTQYSQTLTASTTNPGPFAWSVSQGALPFGFTLTGNSDNTATFAGIATTTSTSTFTVMVGNGVATTTQAYNDLVIGVAVAPVLTGEQQSSVSDTSVTITWTTDHNATSRVVWGTSSVLDASTTEAGAPNYGYANSTTEDGSLVTTHSVTVSGLSANTTYYFRPVSHGSPEAVGKEVSATTGAAPVVVTPPSNGGGGGGNGGGGIVGSGPLSIGFVNTNPNAISLPGAVLGASTNCFVFTQSLVVGSTGTQVSELQTRLTLEGLFKANATGYFGSITKAAVAAFQAKNGIEQVGTVGPKTRAALNASCTGTTNPSTTTPSAGTVLGASTSVFTQNLMVGSIGAEVTTLQKVLMDMGYLKIAAPTGYFGSITKAAVMDYQASRGIEQTGNTGPKTRAALNSNAAAVK